MPSKLPDARKSVASALVVVRRRALPASAVVLAGGVVAAAPGWWVRLLDCSASAIGAHWLPALLLVGGTAGVIWRAAVGLHRRRWPNTVRRQRREPVALWLPLSAHVAGLLLVAVLVAIGTGALLWRALGAPTIHTSGGAGTEGWTVTNTFDALKIVLSVVAGIGAVVALTVSYRKQDQGEAAEHREDTKLFTDRFGRAADQLGSDKAAVRLAGVYAMARLADDWAEDRQTCIDVLCAYLRMPYTPPPAPAAKPDPAAPAPDQTVTGRDPSEERQIRQTVIRLLGEHLRLSTPDAGPRWHGHRFDLFGAVLDGYSDLSRIDFPAGTTLDLGGVTFSGGIVDLRGATFSGGMVSFNAATFSSGIVCFDSARFSGSTVTFDKAIYSGSTVQFRGATFSGGKVTFTGAKVLGGAVDLDRATFSGSTVSLDATFSGGTVTFNSAAFSDGILGLCLATFSGSTVTFTNATLSGGTVSFDDAVFSGGIVGFNGAAFSGSTVSLSRAEFQGGLVALGKPRDWSVPPSGLPENTTPGLQLPTSEYLKGLLGGTNSSGAPA